MLAWRVRPGASVVSPGLIEADTQDASAAKQSTPARPPWYDAFLPTADVQLGTTLVNRWSGQDEAQRESNIIG